MDKLEKMIDLSAQRKQLHAEELPPIELYIDQLISLISQRFESADDSSEERRLIHA